jgi:cation:H+ antiporter
MMVWLSFLFASAVVVIAAMKLAEYGDVISVRTGLGGLFIGLILMAGATSLPELLTTINSIQQGIPDLAAGNMFGSNMFNMLLLGVIDLINWRVRILRQVAHRHSLSGSVAVLLIAMGVFFVVADLDISIGWVGLDSLLMIAAYILGMRIIQRSAVAPADAMPDEIPEGLPSLRHGLIGFSIATIALILIMPLLVSASGQIAEITGLGTGFVGTALVAIVTSLPELVTTIAAVRLGVYDMAVGNLFGSNMFNMFALGISDFFMLDGNFLNVITDDFLLVGLIGLLMTIFGLIGNQARLERKIWFVEIDALILILIYFLGMLLIYQRGIGI